MSDEILTRQGPKLGAWSAMYKGDNSVVGFGYTEADAIADLRAKHPRMSDDGTYVHRLDEREGDQ